MSDLNRNWLDLFKDPGFNNDCFSDAPYVVWGVSIYQDLCLSVIVSGPLNRQHNSKKMYLNKTRLDRRCLNDQAILLEYNTLKGVYQVRM